MRAIRAASIGLISVLAAAIGASSKASAGSSRYMFARLGLLIPMLFSGLTFAAPDAPTIDSIVSGNGQATITFTPGLDNGSSIIGYRYIRDDNNVLTTIFGATGSDPRGIALDAVGNVYTANLNSDNVSKITPDGTSTILGATGDAPFSIVLDAAGNVYIANNGSDNVSKITPDGTSIILGATGNSPLGIALDAAGNVYTANSGSNNVSKITPDGTSTILGATDSTPWGIALDAAGNVYIANFGSDNVTKITPDGTSTILGTTGSNPRGIAVDAAGNVYTANPFSDNVSKITPDGTSTILATTGSRPSGIAVDAAGNVYTSNISGNYSGSGNVSKITPDGTSIILEATDDGPYDIALGADGGVYTANRASNNVSKIADSSDVAFPATGNSSPVMITGLTNGTNYLISLIAVNTEGQSVASGALAVTPGAPDAPTIDSIVPGNSQVIVNFTPGADNGSLATNYEYSLDGTNYTALDPAGFTSPVTITGLSNGTAYLIALRAINTRGTGAVSDSASVTPGTPVAPTIDSIVSGNGQATITFTPGLDNGSSVTNYEYSLDGTNYTALDPATSTSPITITGLSNGTTYSITLRAVNGEGAGAASASGIFIAGAPNAPTIDSIVPGDGQVVITFTPGGDNGSSISNYEYSSDGTNYTALAPATSTSPITITGLSNGAAYSITLRAVNGEGAGAASASGLVIPGTPVAPTIDSIEPGNDQATISFTPGADNGLSITGYRYTRDDGSVTSTILGTTGDSAFGIVLDADGNVYTANAGNNTVSKITPDGTSTILGITGSVPLSIALDADGNVYTSNRDSSNVSKITPDGTSTILGITGFQPQAIAVDAAGNVYTANFFSNVSKITPDGTSTTFGTTGAIPKGIAVDAAGNVYTANFSSDNVTKITPDGTSTILGTTGDGPQAIAVDAAGNVYTANSDSDNVSKITPDGTSTILGATDSTPWGIALDAAGNVYIANSGSNNVSKITPDGTSTILGATGANSSPYGIAVDAAGNVYTTNVGSDNVSKITDASTVTYPATGDSSPITISGVANGTPYLISLIAVSAEAQSMASDAVAVTPGAPDAPTIDSIVPGDGQAIITFTPGADNDSSVTNYQYSLDGTDYTALNPADAFSPITITGLTNGIEYSITFRALNDRGTGAASDSGSVTPGTPAAPTIDSIAPGVNQATITFTPGASNVSSIFNYEYSLDGTNYTALNPVDTNSPITITGLSNGTTYPITLRALNAEGAGAASDSAFVAPGTPVAPTIDSIVPGNGQAIITFTPGADNGSSISNYEYSLDGTSYTALDPLDTTSPITIAGLSNGTTYTITLRAANGEGAGAASASGLVTAGAPDAPTIDSIVSGNGQAIITFTPGADNGSSITGYRYIRDDGPGSIGSTFIGTTGVPLLDIAVDANGNVYTASAFPSRVSKITPDGTSTILGTAGTRPLAIAVDAAGNVYIANGLSSNVRKITPEGSSTTLGTSANFDNFSLSADIAIDATGYVYTVHGSSGNNNVTKISPDGTSTIFGTTGTFPGAIALDANGNVYTANEGSDNVSKITPNDTSTILGATGSSPFGIAVDAAGNVYTANSVSNNVSKITPDGTSTILGTTGDRPRAIAVDAAGNVYTANNDSNNVSKITPDGTSTILGITGNRPKAIAVDSAGNVYTANSSSVSKIGDASAVTFPATGNSSPITIAGLANGTDYMFSLIAVNAQGQSIASGAVAVTVGLPDAPTIDSIVPGDGQALIYFLAGAANGSAVTNYEYSLDSTNYTALNPADTASPIMIAGLTNGTTYSFALRATNNEGAGAASDSAFVTPGTPVAPTIASIESGNGQAIITFTPGGDNGSSISNYEYSLDGTNYTALDPVDSTSPITIVGLSNGTTYTITLRATNDEGAGPASGSGLVTAGAPNAPTITSIESGNGQAIITFTPGGDNGSSISNYEYSLDGTNYTALDPVDSTSPITIAGLSNGTTYTITLRALNARGAGAASGSAFVTTGTPLAPTIDSIVPGDGQAVITFTPGADNGSSISNYEYSFDGTNYTALDPATSASPITITGLSNGAAYSITLRALNGEGAGAASASGLVIPGTPVAPTIDSIVPGDGQAVITFTPGAGGGSPITSYRYVRDDGSISSTILGITGASPRAIAVDTAGNVYTANAENNTVSKITPNGTSTILGTTGNNPRGIALDAAGNVYTANRDSDNVSKITPDGTSTIIGTTGDSTGPQAIAVDAAGDVYTANGSSNNVSKITPNGNSTIFGTTQTNPIAIALDAAGNVYTANFSSDNVTKITTNGISTTLETTGLGFDAIAIAIDAAGNVYIANFNSDNVSKITADGTSTILGTTGRNPRGIAIDAAGNVYTANEGSDNVSKITPDGTSTILGATGSSPFGIAVDAAGNVYTANALSDSVSKITNASTVTYPATGNASPIRITGLSNGTGYIISLIAVNNAGQGVASNGALVTPIGLPATPQITNTDYGDGEIYISVSVSNNGGSAISSYTATCTDGTTQYIGTSTTSRITVSGLANDVSYSCFVTATSTAGTSAPSAGSAPITPESMAVGLPIWLLYEATK